MKELKKILIFIDWYLPGYKAGGPIQSCANLVSHLGPEFEFYIVTRNTDYCSSIPYADVPSDKWEIISGVNSYYISKTNLGYNTLRLLVNDVRPDIVYINGVYSPYFSVLPLIISKNFKSSKIIVATRGMLASSAVNVKSLKKRLFFNLARVIKLYNGVQFHATNESERSDIESILGSKAIVKVAPNLPAKIINNQTNAFRIKQKGELRLVSIARVSPEKNTYFAIELLSKYKGAANIIFDIYGPVYNESYWDSCKQLMAKIPSNIKINYCGSLEKTKVEKTLSNYHALLLPTQGENFGHIILESLTAGCSVIISDQTPWKDLENKGIGYDLSLADQLSFHSAIDDLAMLDQEEFNILSDKAFTFAKSYIENEEHLEANRKLFI